MLLADRPTTSRWAPPPTGANTPYQVRPILEGKNRGRHFARKTPSPGSQIALEPDLGSASDPTRTVARAGTHNATPGLLLLSRPLGPRYRTPRATRGRTWRCDDRLPPDLAIQSSSGGSCVLRLREPESTRPDPVAASLLGQAEPRLRRATARFPDSRRSRVTSPELSRGSTCAPWAHRLVAYQGKKSCWKRETESTR